MKEDEAYIDGLWKPVRCE